MASSQTELYESLNAYLQWTVETLTRWSEWLAEHERLVLQADFRALELHAQTAVSLHDDLAKVATKRNELLAQAQAAGIQVSTLKQLAKTLPEWQSVPDLRRKVKHAERCMTTLRQLNTAAWLLINQCARVVDETMMLMTKGSTMQGAYVDVPQADMIGGQILDAQI